MNTVEDWAKKIVANELGKKVEVHDDGSESGMYDLRIGSKNAPDYAIECVGAVDPVATETWNVGPATGPIKIDSSGDWGVSIRKSANIKTLNRNIAKVIGQCEDLGLSESTPVDWQLKRFNAELFSALDNLGITFFYMYREEGSGNVHLSMDGGGGVVNQSSDDLVDWVSKFLSADDQADVVKKLRVSSAKEKHVFIPIAHGGAPWSVESYFLSEMLAPKNSPKLPEPITGVWITSNSKGVRYLDGQWHIFSY
jgi:hypothetical protein